MTLRIRFAPCGSLQNVCDRQYSVVPFCTIFSIRAQPKTAAAVRADREGCDLGDYGHEDGAGTKAEENVPYLAEIPARV